MNLKFNKIHKFISIFICVLFSILILKNIMTVEIGYDKSDSPSYFNFDLDNPLRMPLITFIYSRIYFLGAISLIQNILSLIAWLTLAYSVQLRVNNPNIKILSILLILTLGITAQVQEHNFVILSESFTITGLIFIFSFLLLYFFHNQSNLTLFLLCLSTIFFAGVKQSNNYFSITIIFMIFIYLLQNKTIKLISFMFLVTTLSILVIFVKIGNQNLDIKSNLTITTIIERTYDDYSARKYWENLDFPPIAYEVYSSQPTKNPIDMLNETPHIINWKQNSSKYLVESYALRNPGFLLLGPLKPNLYIKNFTDFESILNYIANGTSYKSENSFLNWRTGYFDSSIFQKLFSFPSFYWSSSPATSQLILIIIFTFFFINLILLNLNANKYTDIKIFIFIQITFLFILAAIWLTWHITVTYEMARYLVPWAIVLRVLLILSCVLVLDKVKKRDV